MRKPTDSVADWMRTLSFAAPSLLSSAEAAAWAKRRLKPSRRSAQGEVAQSQLAAMSSEFDVAKVGRAEIVNAVTPGTIDAQTGRSVVPAQVLGDRAKGIPIGRLGTPQEMANMIVFLLSPVASYVTGQISNCDAGRANSLFFVPMRVASSGGPTSTPA